MLSKTEDIYESEYFQFCYQCKTGKVIVKAHSTKPALLLIDNLEEIKELLKLIDDAIYGIAYAKSNFTSNKFICVFTKQSDRFFSIYNRKEKTTGIIINLSMFTDQVYDLQTGLKSLIKAKTLITKLAGK